MDCAGKQLDLSQPVVMGVLNITPDSFFDGGVCYDVDLALAQARTMWRDGAAIIDVGGQSTRPGSQEVGPQEEMRRVIPVIEALVKTINIPISIDTSQPEVMAAAVEAGAGMVNDVYALRRPGALQILSDLAVPVCLMHMRGEPRTMQENPIYDDVVTEVGEFLQQRIDACCAAGIALERLIIDPGIGFGKTTQHNVSLVKNLELLKKLALPILVGASRKSFIGTLLDRPVDQRLYGSLAVASLAVYSGARIIRTHDVGPTYDVIKLTNAVIGEDAA